MREDSLIYHGEDASLPLIGYLAYPANSAQLSPIVLVASDWSGCGDFAKEKARFLASLGYIGFAIDLYGKGKTGNTREEKQKLVAPLLSNRLLLRERMLAAFHTVQKAPLTCPPDLQKIGAIGFCLGGMGVLDLARTGVDIKGVVSFHGLLHTSDNFSKAPITSKVLALHGYEDPMVTPAQVEAFANEMTESGADWQIHMYGHTLHAFTNPQANDRDFGTVYNPMMEKRAFQAMKNFFEEIF